MIQQAHDQLAMIIQGNKNERRPIQAPATKNPSAIKPRMVGSKSTPFKNKSKSNTTLRTPIVMQPVRSEKCPQHDLKAISMSDKITPQQKTKGKEKRNEIMRLEIVSEKLVVLMNK